MEFIDYIGRIKDMSSGEDVIRGRHCYKIDSKYVSFWIDEKEGYLNGLQYMNKDMFFWNWSKPKEFYNKYLSGSNDLKFELHSFRKYGESKLAKPKELKGIRQSFSVDYISKKCRCQIFIHENDVWIKHGDYFSPSMDLPTEDSGAPLSVLANKYMDRGRSKKFIYDDAWGDIVLRQEAWIKLNNLVYWIKDGMFELDILKELMRQQEKLHSFDEYELVSSNMERFMERVIAEVKKNLEGW